MILGTILILLAWFVEMPLWLSVVVSVLGWCSMLVGIGLVWFYFGGRKK